MSISLNNHESRIAALEKYKSTSSFKTTVLATVNSTYASTITLSEPIDNYDMIAVYASHDDGTDRYFEIHIPKYMVSNKNIILVSRNYYWLANLNSDRKSFKTTEETNAFIHSIIGIKWGGGISLRLFLRKSINWLNSYFHFLKMEVK